MRVKIYQPTKSTMQSGRGKTKVFILESDAIGLRRPEPLMGWTASGDTLNQVRMKFTSVEDAVRHAQAQGWEYVIEPVQERKVKPRSYADNFKYIPPIATSGTRS
jgi:hypothetical protein